MQFFVCNHLEDRTQADGLVLPFWKGKKGAEPAAHFQKLNTFFDIPVHAKDFQGKEGEVLTLYPSYPPSKAKSKAKKSEQRLILLGLGDKKKFSLEILRRVLASLVKVCRTKALEQLNIVVPQVDDEKQSLFAALCEGVALTDYRFDRFREKAAAEISHIKKVTWIGGDRKNLHACKKAVQIVDAVNSARDLINGNADDVTPQTLVFAAEGIKKSFSKIKVIAFDRRKIEKEKLGLLAAVSRGASVEPAFILIEYRGNPDSPDYTALVGKGITFDTGGLNIKQTGQMETMKDDMSGGAAVLGTIRAAADLDLSVNLIGVIAATENAIGPASYKPGDVYRSYSGKTVEISNTDAEGRLVLADAISYVQDKYQLTQIIDLATLTGGIVIALGDEFSGLFSNNDKLAKALIEAGERTAERLWRMPLIPEYKEQLKSSIADIKNAGGRKASSATAAAFIHEFIKDDLPWAHLDIAGTAFLSEPRRYHSTLATGVGVRLLIDFLINAL